MKAPSLDRDDLNLKKTFYCPRCGRKKLCRGFRYQQMGGGHHHAFYGCTHNRPGKTYRAKDPSGPPCGLIIEVEDRNATLDDLDVLTRLSQVSGPEIQQWLLKNDSTINRRGMEVLYEGPLVDAVRRRDEDGVGVALYWRAKTWSQDEGILNPFLPAYDALRAEAASYVMFRGTPVRDLFRRNDTEIWAKDDDAHPFKGGLGKRLKAKIVEWVAALELALPALIEECQAEQDRWLKEKRHFEWSIGNIINQQGLSLTHYNGDDRTAGITFRDVSPVEALAISKTLSMEFTLSALAVRPRTVSIETAIRLQEVMAPVEQMFDISGLFKQYGHNRTEPRRRLILDEALEVAKILAGREEVSP